MGILTNYTSNQGEEYYKFLYNRLYFINDPKLEEEVKQEMEQKVLDNPELQNYQSYLDGEVKKLREQYDEFWVQNNQNTQMNERQKNLNPIRCMENFHKFVENTMTNNQQSNFDLKDLMAQIEYQNLNSNKDDRNQKEIKNRGKRIVLKKIERDMQSQYMTDEQGNQITFEEWEYNQKYIDYKSHQWSEINPIDLKSVQNDDVKIANYRFTVPEGIQREGIIFYVHNYGTCTKNFAYLGEQFADKGYEFCGIDQRGFGESGGERGQIEDLNNVLKEIQNFNEIYYEKYGKNENGQNLPAFILGPSMGGLLSTFIATQNNNKIQYQGMCILAPYFKLKKPQSMDKIKPMLQMMSKINPNKTIPFGGNKIKLHLKEWQNDPLYLGRQISYKNILEMEKSLNRFENEKISQQINVPTLLFVSGKDEAVCNKAIHKFFDEIQIEDKQIITFEDMDHGILHDREYFDIIINDIVAWMNIRSLQ